MNHFTSNVTLDKLNRICNSRSLDYNNDDYAEIIVSERIEHVKIN